MLLTNQKTINYENLHKNFQEPPFLFLLMQIYFSNCIIFSKKITLTQLIQFYINFKG